MADQEYFELTDSAQAPVRAHKTGDKALVINGSEVALVDQDTVQAAADARIEELRGWIAGRDSYTTLALASAAGETTASVEVLNDPDTDNNGLWIWSDGYLVKSPLDYTVMIKSLQILVNGINADIYSELPWKKGFWQIGSGASDPNGSDIGYNLGQYSWIARIDISLYESVVFTGLYNGSTVSTSTIIYPGIAIYGDGVLLTTVRDASGTTVIDLSDYADYSVVEAVIQDRASAHGVSSFDGTGSVLAYRSPLVRRVDLPEISTLQTTVDKMSVVIDGADSDVHSELEWMKSWWKVDYTTTPKTVTNVSYNSVQYVWSTRLDVSSFESVTVSGLLNGGPLSNTTTGYEAVIVLGDGQYVDRIRDGSGTTTLYLSDYSDYETVELIIQDRASANGVSSFDGSGSVRVYRSPLRTASVAKRLVVVGDSLVGNKSALVVKQLNSILAANGYDPLIARTMGGENAIGNLTRCGGLGIRVLSDFTIPAAGAVDVRLGSAWMQSDGTYATTPYATLSTAQYLNINGVVGQIETMSSDIAAMAFYGNANELISYKTDTGTYQAPAGTAYMRYCISATALGVPHVTIAGVAIDIDSTATINGYISTDGSFVADADYLASDYIALTAGDSVYFDNLAVAAGYTFTRLSDGSEVNVATGSVVFDTALTEDADYPHIFFTGQNGGYEDSSDWAAMIGSAAGNFNGQHLVCSTALIRTTPELVREATIAFGAAYLDLRGYTQGQAVYDGKAFGLLDANATTADYETLFWGADPVHQNEICSYIWAAKMWNRLLELGFVEGDRVDSGDLFVA